jgi:putative transposase
VSRPRQVFAEDTVMATKRCVGGQFRLRPDRLVVQVYLYVLGYCQQKYNILLFDFIGMSNHDHPVYKAPDGNGPRFIQLLHSLVARAVNCHFGEWDCLWSGQKHSALRLLEPSDVKARCFYALLNVVKDGLVRYAKDWAGVTSWHMEYGVPVTIERPPFFFSKKMPDTVRLVISRPQGLYPGLSDREARAKLRADATVKQGDLIAKRKSQGRTFMGMKRVLRQPRHNTPNTHVERRGVRPNIASRSKWARIEALQALESFHVEHEVARLEYVNGNYDVEFPPGTYKMRVEFNCNCAGPAPPDKPAPAQ